MPTVFLLAPL
jgi:hypothetical protein